MALAGAALLLAASLAVLHGRLAALPASEGALVRGAQRPLLFVQAGAAAGGDGSEAQPFSSIAAALRAAAPGAELRIAAGTYPERLSLGRAARLVGAGAGSTRIVSPSAGGVTVQVAGASHVELQGLAIEGGEVGLDVDGGMGHALADVALRFQHGAGLQAHKAELSFERGEIIDVAQGRTGVGLIAEGGALTVRGTVLRRAGRRAVVLRGARGRLEQLDCEGSSLSAVQVTQSAEVEVVGGRFSHNGGAALFASASTLRASGVRIEHNELGVVAFRGARLHLEGAEIFDHQVAGVALAGASGLVRRSVVARGGTDAAIAVSDTKGVTLEENTVFDPGPVGIHITRAEVVLRGNDVRGAALDRQRDFGDGLFALQAQLILSGNVLRANAGSGAAASDTRLVVRRNDLLANGRAGLLLFNSSQAEVEENLFQGNRTAGIQASERSRASLRGNRFGEALGPPIDELCSDPDRRGAVELLDGNSFASLSRRASCL
jgi:nitrous oxidase accessory protein NosD